MAEKSDEQEGQTAWLQSYLTLAWFALACYLLLLIFRYANKMFRLQNFVTVYVAYGCGLGIVIAAPIDVSYTIKARQHATRETIDDYESETEALVGQYQALYWMLIFLGLLLYWVEIYSHCGYYSTVDKIKDTTKVMALDYFAMGVAGILFLVTLVVTDSVPAESDALSSTVVSVGNSVGIVLIVAILGISLVAFPTSLYRSADYRGELDRLKLAAAADFAALRRAQQRLQHAAASCALTVEVVEKRQGGASGGARGESLAAHCDLVREEMPRQQAPSSSGLQQQQRHQRRLCTSNIGGSVEFAPKPLRCCLWLSRAGSLSPTYSQNSRQGGELASREASDSFVTKHELAKVLKRLIKAKAAFSTANGRWEQCKRKAFYYMDILDAIERANSLADGDLAHDQEPLQRFRGKSLQPRRRRGSVGSVTIEWTEEVTGAGTVSGRFRFEKSNDIGGADARGADAHQQLPMHRKQLLRFLVRAAACALRGCCCCCYSAARRTDFAYHVRWRPWILRASALACGVLSGTLLLAQAGALSGDASSPLAFLSLAIRDRGATAFGVTVLVGTLLFYSLALLLWGLFQIRAAHLMQMLPNNGTTPKSFSFNARQVGKLCPPLVFNFLGLLFENGGESEGGRNSHIRTSKTVAATGTSPTSFERADFPNAFTRMYGDLLPPGVQQFSLYATSAMLVLAVLTATNAVNRLLVLLRLHSLQFGSNPLDLSASDIAEGERQLVRHRKITQRAAQRKRELLGDGSEKLTRRRAEPSNAVSRERDSGPSGSGGVKEAEEPRGRGAGGGGGALAAILRACKVSHRHEGGAGGEGSSSSSSLKNLAHTPMRRMSSHDLVQFGLERLRPLKGSVGRCYLATREAQVALDRSRVRLLSATPGKHRPSPSPLGIDQPESSTTDGAGVSDTNASVASWFFGYGKKAAAVKTTDKNRKSVTTSGCAETPTRHFEGEDGIGSVTAQRLFVQLKMPGILEFWASKEEAHAFANAAQERSDDRSTDAQGDEKETVAPPLASLYSVHLETVITVRRSRSAPVVEVELMDGTIVLDFSDDEEVGPELVEGCRDEGSNCWEGAGAVSVDGKSSAAGVATTRAEQLADAWRKRIDAFHAFAVDPSLTILQVNDDDDDDDDDNDEAAEHGHQEAAYQKDGLEQDDVSQNSMAKPLHEKKTEKKAKRRMSRRPSLTLVVLQGLEFDTGDDAGDFIDIEKTFGVKLDGSSEAREGEKGESRQNGAASQGPQAAPRTTRDTRTPDEGSKILLKRESSIAPDPLEGWLQIIHGHEEKTEGGALDEGAVSPSRPEPSSDATPASLRSHWSLFSRIRKHKTLSARDAQKRPIRQWVAVDPATGHIIVRASKPSSKRKLFFGFRANAAKRTDDGNDKDEGEEGEEEAASIELSMDLRIVGRLGVDAEDPRVLFIEDWKFLASDEHEAEYWVDGLQAWRDWLLIYATRQAQV